MSPSAVCFTSLPVRGQLLRPCTFQDVLCRKRTWFSRAKWTQRYRHIWVSGQRPIFLFQIFPFSHSFTSRWKCNSKKCLLFKAPTKTTWNFIRQIKHPNEKDQESNPQRTKLLSVWPLFKLQISVSHKMRTTRLLTASFPGLYWELILYKSINVKPHRSTQHFLEKWFH